MQEGAFFVFNERTVVMAKWLEHIRALRDGGPGLPPIAKLLGMRIAEAEEGRVVMQMKADKRYANPIGTLHGGVICDLGDAAMGTAFATTCEQEESYTTVELKCNYLRPVWETMLTASAWVVYRGKTTGLVECEVKDEQGKLVAKLSSTLMALRGEASKGRLIVR
jgi:uncharacterized protein (TIGR00369 family)